MVQEGFEENFKMIHNVMRLSLSCGAECDICSC